MSPSDEAPEDAGDVRCTFECEASSATWSVVFATITEELNEPYHLSLSLRTEDIEADPTEMLGESCTLLIERGELTNQYPAVVHRIEDTATGNRFMEIGVEASAALWMLSQNRQTRIFQDATVPEILDKVLSDGLSGYNRQYDTDLSEYPKCEYRVQYDESDLQFCERLMEEAGILYRFDREGSTEVLWLADDPHASVDIESVAGGKSVHFSAQLGARECVQGFSRSSSMRPTKLAMRHFNWTLPALPTELEQKGEGKGGVVDGSAIGPLRETYQHDRLPPTYYDYSDDDGYQSNDAEDQCQRRRELDARDKVVMHGQGSVSNFCAGGNFELLDHNLEGEYVLTQVNHSFSSDGHAISYSNNFACIPAETPFRPDRRAPKPRVLGIETARVVGPSGQEIHTDKHGRIKVQFHWDREGCNDDHSSCFIRVVQPWAGAGWGFVFTPRVGMEVTVAFVQGDPDRPIVTGTVYNGENLTSYEMPNEMTKSTIRTQSSPGGDGFNELTFEDKAGAEEVFLQAQKDLNETVKNNQSTTVGSDKSLSVGNDHSTSVSNNQTNDVGNDRTETVSNNKATTVGSNFDHTVGSNLTETVGSDMSVTVGQNKKLNVGIKLDQIIGGMNAITVGGMMSEKVGASRSCVAAGAWSATAGLSAKLQSAKNIAIKAQKNVETSADEAMKQTSGKAMSIAAGKELAVTAGEDFSLKGDKKGVIELKDELTIKVGSAQITMKKNGDIVIKGGKIKVEGSGDVVIKGSKVGIN